MKRGQHREGSGFAGQRHRQLAFHRGPPGTSKTCRQVAGEGHVRLGVGIRADRNADRVHHAEHLALHIGQRVHADRTGRAHPGRRIGGAGGRDRLRAPDLAGFRPASDAGGKDNNDERSKTSLVSMRLPPWLTLRGSVAREIPATPTSNRTASSPVGPPQRETSQNPNCFCLARRPGCPHTCEAPKKGVTRLTWRTDP